jgi:hypothetical protein
MADVETKFSEWCILELFGHKKLAGLVSEVTMGGGAFLRVDVPRNAEEMEYTRYYNPSAIYSMSPVGKEIALAFADRIKEPPVTRWEIQTQPALIGSGGRHGDDEDEEDY